MEGSELGITASHVPMAQGLHCICSKFNGTVFKDSTIQVSRGGGGTEMKMKEEPMLQLTKSGSSTDKAFPVCISVNCDMNGDVPLLTYSTETENERCNTGGERIQ